MERTGLERTVVKKTEMKKQVMERTGDGDDGEMEREDRDVDRPPVSSL